MLPLLLTTNNVDPRGPAFGTLRTERITANRKKSNYFLIRWRSFSDYTTRSEPVLSG